MLLILLFFLAEALAGSGLTTHCGVVQDVLDHPFLNLVYYTACELVPSALVLYILRKLPPRRSQQGYQQIPVR